MANTRERKSIVGFVDHLIGAPLHWVTGRPAADAPSPQRAPRSEVDDALGELASWTGLGGKRRRDSR